MTKLDLPELILIREEVLTILDSISVRGFSLDDTCPHIDFQKIRYKRLVRLYEKLDKCILSSFDELNSGNSSDCAVL